VNGRDCKFSQTVNVAAGYHVFITPNGDCKGLYVSNKTTYGFEVRELGAGTSSMTFDYRLVAKRTGYENVRLTDLTEQFNKLARNATSENAASGADLVCSEGSPCRQSNHNSELRRKLWSYKPSEQASVISGGRDASFWPLREV
jgi:hypothetical protein